MRSVAVAASKGGVGKSTTAQAVIQRAAWHGLNVLGVDADATATLTRRMLGLDTSLEEGVMETDTLVELLDWCANPAPDREPPRSEDLTSKLTGTLLDALRKPTMSGEDIVSGVRRSWGTTVGLIGSPGLPLDDWNREGPGQRGGIDALQTFLRQFEGVYDLAVIDTSPDFAFTTSTALAAATDLLLVVDGSPEAQSGLFDGAQQVMLEISHCLRTGVKPPAFAGISVTKRKADSQVSVGERSALARLDDPRVAKHVAATYRQSTLWARAAAEGVSPREAAENVPALAASLAAADQQTDEILRRLGFEIPAVEEQETISVADAAQGELANA